MKTTNFLDLFSGIGGFALGAYWAGMKFEHHFNSDIEKYANDLYKLRFPDSIQLGDITKIDGKELKNKYNRGWIITGGFPCQPFSSASRGVKVAIDLWPEMLRIIKEIRPLFIIAENVTKKSIKIAGDQLTDDGYKVSICNIGAHEIGADHKRNRWWLLAYSNNKNEFPLSINAKMEMLPSLEKTLWGWENYSRTIRVSNGVSNRVDRLKGLGNSIVPQIAELLFRQISRKQMQWQNSGDK